ncbi:DnaJ domain-containing protein [Haloterrigena salinisoli]|uniref:J domain-containing protein n=1 Tax=Haloterrigena salinisoli TaxID=3132747 RepID=UPI0030D0D63F
MGETYYDVLEVDPDATREEIQTAYRERVLETHPDHNDAPDAAEQFKRVSTAKSVLTDGTERARYDRLGHESYVRLADHSAGDGTAGDSSAPTDESNTSAETASNASTTNGSNASTGDSSDDASANAAGSRSKRCANSRTGSKSGRRHTNGRTATDSSRAESGRSGSQRGARTESHHARQRKRRRQQRTRQRATSGWSFGAETTATAAASNRGGSTATATGADRDAGASEFRYAVHDWTGDVDLEWEGQSLEYSTAVTVGCCWLLYPVFVAVTLTPVFSMAVSAIVGTCMLGLVGYLLTRPRVASLVFGSWSVLFPIGIDWLVPLSQFSLVGLVAIGFAWIPFGYALALWWALRP